jgi:hypothetical protein
MTMAVHTTPSLRPDVEVIVASARAQGHPESGSAIVFGYALDGTFWEELRRRGPMPNTTLDLDHPFWRGAFWAIYPERTHSLGRNDVVLGARTLIGVWSEDNVEKLNAKLQAARASGGADLTGLPIVVNRPGDPVYAAGQRIARVLASALLDSDDGRALLTQFPERLRQQAIIVLAHEFIWSIMDELTRSGVLQTSVARSAQHLSDADLRAFLFIVTEEEPR